MLIPPSALAVLLASLAEQSVAQLLVAGIVPGILMAVLFFGYVIGRCAINPALAPAYQAETDIFDRAVTVSLNFGGRAGPTWAYSGRYRRLINRVLPSVLYVLPLFVIFVVVVGSIFFKVASPTEAAALGCLASLGVCYVFRVFRSTIRVSGIEGADFDRRAIAKALLETAKINTMILFSSQAHWFSVRHCRIRALQMGYCFSLGQWN